MSHTNLFSNGNLYWGEIIRLHETVILYDRNSTIAASEVIIASASGLFYFILFMLGVLGVWIKSCARLCSSQGTFFVFFIGVLIASVNVFTNADNLEVRLYFRSSSAIVIGIAYVLFGALLFFSLPREGEHPRTMGHQQPSMGCVIGMITLPLFLIEALFLTFACTKETRKSLEEHDPSGKLWILVISDKSTFLLQKSIQMGMYFYMRATTLVDDEYKDNAEFYFRLLSFFNLIEWIDAQVNGDNDVLLSGPIIANLDGWLAVLIVLYKALIIDYRLLCSLLFLEHSLEIATEDHVAAENQQNINALSISNMTPRNQLRMCGGYMMGGLFLTAPLFCGLQYLDILSIKGWVEIFAIFVNVAILIFGACFLLSDNLEDGGNREAPGVKTMVCCLGGVGLICWLIKGAIAAYWAATAHARAEWDAAKFSFRGCTAAFLMYLLMKVNAKALPLQNPTSTKNHFLVPILLLGIFSMFLETLIDQYVGPFEKRLRNEIDEQSLRILLEAGPPMYLGFLIHLVLHFIIIQSRIRRRRQANEGVGAGGDSGAAVDDPLLPIPLD